jgi:uncharacterized iron-regulated membrane protein
MTTTARSRTPDAPPARRSRPGASGTFRAFWRWHFYASFLVVPILLVLSVTGLIYLFRFQLEPLLHPDLMTVSAPSDTAIQQPYANQLAAVERAHPDATVVSMSEPREDGRSTVFSVTTDDGTARDVFVNPYGAEVLGSLDPDRTVSGIAVLLHGELMSGTVGDLVIELGACWAIVMALTGYYLFVRGWKARRRRLAKGAPGARLRSSHGVVGAVVGVGLLFLLVSGLPWTGLWGAKVQELATAQGSSLWSEDHGALSDPTSSLDESLPHSHSVEVPWGMGESEVPRSTAPEDGEEGRSVANLDTAVLAAADAGLRHPMTIALPADEEGVFSVIGYAFDAPSDERTVHVDRYGGEVVSTYGFDDYPVLAQVVAQGIGLHEGRSFGTWSMVGTTLMCLAIVFSCVTGPLMWWRRRPSRSGSMGAPRGRMPLRASPLLLVGLVALGILLPLFGLSVLAILLLDQLVVRRVPALAGWFDAA